MAYFDTLINTLRIEMKNEIKKVQGDIDVQQELNANDLSIKQINQKLESFQVESKKMDRLNRQNTSQMQLDFTEKFDRIEKLEKVLNELLKSGTLNKLSAKQEFDAAKNEPDSIRRIQLIERALQNFEKQVAEQLE